MYEFMGEESSQSIKHPQAREKKACKGNKQKDIEYLPFPRANHEDWLPGYWITSSPLPI